MEDIKNIKHEGDLTILGTTISLGESKMLNFNLANLFTDTKVEVPVIVERSKRPGPTVLITAGIHGDEVNGMEIVREVISKEINIPAKGTIICIPILNVFGFINKSRYFPDGRDLNREFPGMQSGSLASRFAYHFVTEILPFADLCMDFHTGGSDRFNAAQIRIERDNPEARKMADIFNTRFTLLENLIPGSYREICHRLGKIILLNESGKTMQFEKEMALEAIQGIKRILKHLGMLHPNIEAPHHPIHTNIVVEENKWIRADCSGFFHVKVALQEFVRKDEILGTILDPYGGDRHAVLATNEGYILNINQEPMVYQGDAIFHISTKVQSKMNSSEEE